jgi:ABC-type nickel/cobalt efflux system permease component RcnA
MGFGHRKTALAAYVLMITSAASAVAIAGQSAAVQLSVTAVWAIIYLALALVIDRRWRRHEVPA